MLLVIILCDGSYANVSGADQELLVETISTEISHTDSEQTSAISDVDVIETTEELTFSQPKVGNLNMLYLLSNLVFLCFTHPVDDSTLMTQILTN